MSTTLDKIDAYRRLGLKSLFQVGLYRLGTMTGLNSVRSITGNIPDGEFFGPSNRQCSLAPSQRWKDSQWCFGWFSKPLNNQTPNWFLDPIHDRESESALSPWWEIPDFVSQEQDIKCIWEASRMDWALAKAQRAVSFADRVENLGSDRSAELLSLNHWLADWCRHNPPYLGPNWKCAQEASIRVLHLAMASIVLYGSDQANGEWLRETKHATACFIEAHLKRIRPTVLYAVAQNNNHALSEACALFIGGTWLGLVQTTLSKRSNTLAAFGRTLLEERTSQLFEQDGSFSQYSVNYHRMALDLLNMAEVWRRKLDLPPFSDDFYAKAKAATDWLGTMTEPTTGDVPNLGHNDGARLMPLTDTDYRDFRPTVQLASNLYHGVRAYCNQGSWDLPGQWLGIDDATSFSPPATTHLFDNGGYAVLGHAIDITNASEPPSLVRIKALLKYPRYRYRPSHADALHVDLWINAENVLRDSGTYSYNAADGLMAYLFGTRSHNTVTFDNRDQMPRVSRFLFGRWPKTRGPVTIEKIESGTLSCSASYTDWLGASHTRRISLSPGGLVVDDEIDGMKKEATVRWNLFETNWIQNGKTFTNENGIHIDILSDVVPTRCELVSRIESQYYWHQHRMPAIEFTVEKRSKIQTVISWPLQKSICS